MYANVFFLKQVQAVEAVQRAAVEAAEAKAKELSATLMEMAQVKRMEFNASLTAVFELRSVDSFSINASVLEAGNTLLCS